jgi:hypothetical protein
LTQDDAIIVTPYHHPMLNVATELAAVSEFFVVDDPLGARQVVGLRLPDGARQPRHALLALHQGLRKISGDYGPRSVELPGRPGAGPHGYTAAFGAKVRFGRPAAVLRLPAGVLSGPADVPAVERSGLAWRVRHSLTDRLGTRSTALGDIAKAIAVHPRTVQRNLIAANVPTPYSSTLTFPCPRSVRVWASPSRPYSADAPADGGAAPPPPTAGHLTRARRQVGRAYRRSRTSLWFQHVTKPEPLRRNLRSPSTVRWDRKSTPSVALPDTEPSAQPAAAQRTTNITMGDDVLGTCDKPAVLYADNAVSSSAGSAPEPQGEGDEAGMAPASAADNDSEELGEPDPLPGPPRVEGVRGSDMVE